jgi:hypothetical protein
MNGQFYLYGLPFMTETNVPDVLAHHGIHHRTGFIL